MPVIAFPIQRKKLIQETRDDKIERIVDNTISFLVDSFVKENLLDPDKGLSEESEFVEYLSWARGIMKSSLNPDSKNTLNEFFKLMLLQFKLIKQVADSETKKITSEKKHFVGLKIV